MLISLESIDWGRKRKERRGSMRISVTQDACIGAGQCALVAPELFDQDDEGIVISLTPEVPEGQEVHARKAASLCPARAIQLIES